MRALTPWNGLSAIRKEMDRVLDTFGGNELPELVTLGEWIPRLEIKEIKDNLLVKAELPGIDPKDLQVTLADQTLTLKGEKKYESEQLDEHVYKAERSFGTFIRTVQLPFAVDEHKIQATFKNGLLTVTLPKAVVGKGAAIPVKVE